MKPRLAMVVIGALSASLLAVGAYPRPQEPIEISYAYSVDIAGLIGPLVDRFNQANLVVGDRPVHVTGVKLGSSQALDDLQLGTVEADAWTPTAKIWGSLYRLRHSDVRIETEIPSLVRSPEVIAMWEDCALELGWSTRGHQPSWEEVLSLVKKQGQGNCTHFALGGTDPSKSTSGLLALASWYDMANGDEPVSPQTLDEKDPSHKVVRRIAHSAIRHFPGTADVVAALCGADDFPSLDAIYVEEHVFLSHNDDRCLGQLASSGMVAVYPSSGTYMADYPLYRVIQPDSSAATDQATGLLGTWLQGKLTPRLVGTYGFRPADGSYPQGLVGAQSGATPWLPTDGAKSEMPSARVAELLQAAWERYCGARRCQ